MYFDGSLIIIIGFQYFKLNRLYEAMLTLDSYFFLGSSSASMLGLSGLQYMTIIIQTFPSQDLYKDQSHVLIDSSIIELTSNHSIGYHVYQNIAHVEYYHQLFFKTYFPFTCCMINIECKLYAQQFASLGSYLNHCRTTKT